MTLLAGHPAVNGARGTGPSNEYHAQARVSDPDSRSEGDLLSVPVAGASRVMIAVRMAPMVMTATVRYPVPGVLSHAQTVPIRPNSGEPRAHISYYCVSSVPNVVRLSI